MNRSYNAATSQSKREEIISILVHNMTLEEIAKFNSKSSRDHDVPEVTTDTTVEILFSPAVGWCTYNNAKLRRLSVGHALSKIENVIRREKLPRYLLDKIMDFFCSKEVIRHPP